MRSRRPWVVAAVLLVVVAIAAVVAGLVLSRRQTAAAPPATVAPPELTEVVRTDLSNSLTLQGAVGHGMKTAFTGRKEGTVTALPAVGATVNPGEALYSVNAKPVVLMKGKLPLYRKLDPTVPPGPDVAQLNESLRGLGYLTGRGEKYGAETEGAVKRWQKKHGLEQTGALDVGDVVFLPDAVRIAAITGQVGGPATAELFSYTSTARAVTAEVDPAKVDVATLKPGAPATVRVSGGRELTGTLGELSPQGEADKQTQTIAVAVDGLDGVESGPVQVRVVTESRTGVLAVPVTALLALGEGGYALQVSDGAGTRLLAVRTGLFAGELVEVTGEGLEAGMKVVRAA